MRSFDFYVARWRSCSGLVLKAVLRSHVSHLALALGISPVQPEF